MQAAALTQNYRVAWHHAGMGKQPPDRAFGKRIQEVIDSHAYAGCALNTVAKRWGVSPAMVSYYKSGEKLPSMKTAMRIAVDSGFCVEYILTGRGPQRPGQPNGDGNTLDISMLPHGQQVHLKALVHEIQEQHTHYQKGQVAG